MWFLNTEPLKGFLKLKISSEVSLGEENTPHYITGKQGNMPWDRTKRGRLNFLNYWCKKLDFGKYEISSHKKRWLPITWHKNGC